MLDFARLGERGRGAINLAEAVHSALALLEPLVRRQRVELVVEGPDLIVVANRSQVQQVVFNLVTNALHALSGPGRVEVRLTAMERDGVAFGVLAVLDDGPGVAEAVRAHLFDAFVTTKPVGRGTGLGLAVCREIAEGHGGWIDVASEPGRTQVRVAFPA
jgi:two-component system C4-dicarboxylate transport sensor histidine kinase DctB